MIEAFLNIKVLFGLIITLLASLFKLYKNSVDKKFVEIINTLEKKDDIINDIKEELHKQDKKLLEYQITANSTFILKDDWQELKADIRKRYENTSRG